MLLGGMKMEEYSLEFTKDSIVQVKFHDKQITQFFEREIRDSEDDEPTVESLRAFKPLYDNMQEYLLEAVEEMKAMEVMGLPLEEEAETEEEIKLLEELLTAIHVLTRKIEIILEFFLTNLGEAVVVEVLDLE